MPDASPLLEFRYDGPPEAECRLALAHGAGAAMDSEFMNAIAARLAKLGVRVARFEFPYMRRRRESGRRGAPDRPPVLRATWQEVVLRLGEGWAIGGKSMGGRIATLVADDVDARAVVCLGYPFHPAGKPERLRVEHLRDLRSPTLIVQGTRDRLGTREEVESYDLPARIRFEWMPDGDHSLKPRVRSGHTLDGNLDLAAGAIAKFLQIG